MVEGELRRIVLSAVDECAVCGQPYAEDSVAVIGRRANIWVISLCCRQCQRQGFVAAVVGGSAEAAVTEPVIRPAQSSSGQVAPSPISLADVQAMRDFLAAFRGDLCRYLTQSTDEPPVLGG